MANSKVGQYRLEFLLTGYTNPTREHVAGLWVAPTAQFTAGALPADIDLQLKGGGSNTLDAVALDYANRIRPFYDGSVSITAYTLWRYTTNNVRDYISSGTVAPTASAGGGTGIAHQATITMRHANGGIARHVFLESVNNDNIRGNILPLATGNSIQRYAAWLLSNASPSIALDNSFPVAALRYSGGQNESVWRKIYRS